MNAYERHYTLRQLEELTGINYHTLRRRLMHVQGVVHLKNNINDPIRIPESVWRREYAKWVNGAL